MILLIASMMTTIQEQALLSGLAFLSYDNETVPKWESSEWPPLLGDRCGHASVVLDHPSKQHQTVVVVGGQGIVDTVDTVVLLNTREKNKRWRKGPGLNEKRFCHAAVVCNGGVYVIGGWGNVSELATIERIDVDDLVRSSSTTSMGKKWRTLLCRLSAPRDDRPGVAAVQNRFIVVAGGDDGNNAVLPSVDIVDTAVKDRHIVAAGPSLNVERCNCGMATIGHRLMLNGAIVEWLQSVIVSMYWAEKMMKGMNWTL